MVCIFFTIATECLVRSGRQMLGYILAKGAPKRDMGSLVVVVTKYGNFVVHLRFIKGSAWICRTATGPPIFCFIVT